MNRFEGKTAIVTGAASGIGRAVAERLWQEGARVGLADIDPDKATATARAISADGARTLVVKTDVADPGAAQQMVEATVGAFGGVDLRRCCDVLVDQMQSLAPQSFQ